MPPTPLYWCPCITYGATRYYLPPHTTATIRQGQTVTTVSPAQSDQFLITELRCNQGTRITLSASGNPSSPGQANVLAWLAAMWSSLKGKTFALNLWSDRGWATCALETMEHAVDLEPMIFLRDVELEIIAEEAEPSAGVQVTFDDYNAEYPYAAEVGLPAGYAADPGGGFVVVVQAAQQSFAGVFTGVVGAETVAGEEHRFTVGGAAGSKWRLKGAQVVSANPALSTNATTVNVSTQPVDGSGGYTLTQSVANGAHSGAVAAGNIQVTAGAVLYAFVENAGGHADVVIRFWLEAE